MLNVYVLDHSCQVYNLTWIERQFASRLFATPPTATIEEAQSAFEEVSPIISFCKT